MLLSVGVRNNLGPLLVLLRGWPLHNINSFTIDHILYLWSRDISAFTPCDPASAELKKLNCQLITAGSFLEAEMQ